MAWLAYEKLDNISTVGICKLGKYNFHHDFLKCCSDN